MRGKTPVRRKVEHLMQHTHTNQACVCDMSTQSGSSRSALHVQMETSEDDAHLRVPEEV